MLSLLPSNIVVDCTRGDKMVHGCKTTNGCHFDTAIFDLSKK